MAKRTDIPASDRARQPQQRRSQQCYKLFLDALRETGSQTRACKIAGVSSVTVREWRLRSEANPEDERYLVLLDDPDWKELGLGPRPVPFFQAYIDARDDAQEILEDTARMLATGYKEPVHHQGRRCWVTNPVKVEEDPITGELIVVQELEYDENGDPIPLTVTKYSERMLEFMLKGYRSGRFGNKVQLEGNLSIKPLGITGFDLTPEQWMEKYGAEKPQSDESAARGKQPS